MGVIAGADLFARIGEEIYRRIKRYNKPENWRDYRTFGG